MPDFIALIIVILAAGACGFTLRHAFIPLPPYRPSFELTDEAIARIAHEANRQYCISLGDFSQRSWLNTEPHVRASTIEGVRYLRTHPNATPEQMHENWCATKRQQGYRYGESKCHRSLRHPCLVPYNELGEAQQFKDYLFHAIVGLVVIRG